MWTKLKFHHYKCEMIFSGGEIKSWIPDASSFSNIFLIFTRSIRFVLSVDKWTKNDKCKKMDTSRARLSHRCTGQSAEYTLSLDKLTLKKSSNNEVFEYIPCFCRTPQPAFCRNNIKWNSFNASVNTPIISTLWFYYYIWPVPEFYSDWIQF